MKVVKLLAQSTGDFTRDELRKDVKLSWTDKTKADIAAAKEAAGAGSGTDNGGNTGGNGGGDNGDDGDAE